MTKRRRVAWAIPVLFAILASTTVRADDVLIAVAANFTTAAREIVTRFEEATGHKVLTSFGSTGQLYTQITRGAPFEVFLAADQARPQKAVDDGFALPGSRFTYATGRIVLFSRQEGFVTDETVLASGQFRKIAIANPATAPYGAAAVETLQSLGLYDALAPKIVTGFNIAQAFQFVETGNAEIGFVALSQLPPHGGSRWLVPRNRHRPIHQDAVLLKRGADNPAARAFMAFLAGPVAGTIKEKYGYDTAE